MSRLITQVRDLLALNASTQDAAVRASLVRSLYASPASLTIGALAGVALSFVVAHEGGHWGLWVVTGLISVLALVRVIAAIYFHRELMHEDSPPSNGWGLAYELGAWSYAGLLGILALATLLLVENAALHMMSVALVCAYSGGISGRNAGRVQVAVGQTCLALLPTSTGLLLHGGLGYTVLAIMLLLMILGMAEITMTTHRIVVQALKGKQEKSALAAKFERLARFDSLTEVENRMAMQGRLRDIFAMKHKSSDAMAVLWLDMDRFKEINDTLGHFVGDQLLRCVVAKMEEAVAGRGHLARFGGDEFIILCPDCNYERARIIAADILELVGTIMDVVGHRIAVTASIGIAVGPQDGRDSEELLQHADMALYHAKQEGRNRFASFNWSMKAHFNRLRDIESGLRNAIENDELTLHYQPIFDTKSGEIVCCEALLRWRHPVLGPVSPAEFIPVAESAGMIEPITEWVLNQACADAAEWPESVRVAVNISPALIKSSIISRAVLGAIMNAGIQPRRLELEVTETVLLQDSPQTNQTLLELQQIGLRLALDDFGTGYSSLSYLRNYPFDTIKVDQSFLKEVKERAEDRAIIRAVVELARSLNMETVAEGVENQDQLAYTRDAGFTNAQGFKLCRPVPLAQLHEIMSGGDHMTGMAHMIRHLAAVR